MAVLWEIAIMRQLPTAPEQELTLIWQICCCLSASIGVISLTSQFGPLIAFQMLALKRASGRSFLSAPKLTNDVKDSQTFIQWFWSEFEKGHRLTSYNDGLCQCETEHFIEATDRPEMTRSFLVLSVFTDQMMFTHFQPIYSEFRSRFHFPKLHSCPEPGRMASPGWFIYSFYGYDKKMDWPSALPVADAIIGDLLRWLKTLVNGEDLIKEFRGLIEIEIRKEFEPKSSKALREVVSQIG
jgi:hypothetical protein